MSLPHNLLLSITKIFQPLDSLNDKDSLAAFVSEFGWVTEITDSELSLIRSSFNISQDLTKMADAIANNDFEKLITSISSISNKLSNLTNNNFPSGTIFRKWSDIHKELTHYLVYNYLASFHPKLFGIFSFFGILSEKIISENTNLGRISYVKKELHLERLPKVLTEFFVVLSDVYKWGSVPYSNNLLLKNSANLLRGFDLESFLVPPSEEILNEYYSDDSIHRDSLNQLQVPLIGYFVNEIGGSIGIHISALPITPEGQKSDPPSGILIIPTIQGTLENEFQLNDLIKLIFTGNFKSEGAIGIKVYPNELKIVNESVQSFKSSIILSIKKEKPIFLFGQSDTSHLSVESFDIEFFLEGENSDLDIGVSSKLNNGEILIQNDGTDGFLNKILPADGIKSNFDFTIGWSRKRGFFIIGSGTLEITVPVHKELGPLKIHTIFIPIGFDGRKIVVIPSSNFSAQLGPITASIEKLGFKIELDFPDNGGNLGPVNLDFDFKPPTGAGLAVNFEDLIKGGGAVSFDNENKRYSGVLDLELKKIGITAIGIITTKMPNGNDGFSMALMLSGKFTPGFPLPFGFTLTKVGGLLGINRSMNVEWIREGLRKGVLDSIMFPSDPITNFTQIVSDMENAFPATDGRYIFGPLVEIQWGKPKALFFGELGILIETPAPVRVALLGQFTVVMPPLEPPANPTDELPLTIVEMHLDLLGVWDQGKKSFALDASLYRSRLTTLKLVGDAALRLEYGSSPFFGLSLGGFHPKFTPPPKFGKLRRLEISLSSGKLIKIDFTCYMAVTSNSVQFGSKLLAKAKKGKFSAVGWFYFDAIIIFSPFSFIVGIGAGVAIKVGSKTLFEISFDLELSGPKPWRVKGKGKFKILFIKITIKVNVRWGSGSPPPLPTIDPWPKLQESLSNPSSYAGILPQEKEMVASLRELNDNATTIIVHPMGLLELRQRVLPFNFRLTRFGKAIPDGEPTYSIKKIEINDIEIPNFEFSKEHFARGEFQKLSNSEKLSTPSYEKFDSGFIVGSTQGKIGASERYELEYESQVIDERKFLVKAKPTVIRWKLGNSLLKNGTAMRNLVLNRGTAKYVPLNSKPMIKLNDEQYVIASTNNLDVREDLTPIQKGGITYAEAKNITESYIKNNPSQSKLIQIIPISEAKN